MKCFALEAQAVQINYILLLFYYFYGVLIHLTTCVYYLLLLRCNTCSLKFTSIHCFVLFPGVPGSAGGVPGSPRVSSQKVQRRSEKVGEGWRKLEKEGWRKLEKEGQRRSEEVRGG